LEASSEDLKNLVVPDKSQEKKTQQSLMINLQNKNVIVINVGGSVYHQGVRIGIFLTYLCTINAWIDAINLLPVTKTMNPIFEALS